MSTPSTLPVITQAELEAVASDTWSFLFLFIDKYGEMIAQDETGQVMQSFSATQHSLMAFNALYGEVTNGGFLQLIQNGYGGYIFDNPFSDIIRAWGAGQIADIVDRAKLIYDADREQLEQETTVEEFADLYHTFRDFEPLDALFYAVMDDETEIIKNYVAQHISDFATIAS